MLHHPTLRVATVLIYLFVLLPILVVIVSAFNDSPALKFPPSGFSLRWFGAFFQSADFGRAARVSLEVAAATAVVTLVLGTAAALALCRHDVPGRLLILQYLTSPLILPSVVVGLALLQVYARIDVTPSRVSLIAGHAAVTLPYAVRAMFAAFSSYDRSLDDAAATLGARPLRAFFRVTLPLVKPGIVAGGVFAFAISFGNIKVSAFLIGPATTTLPVRMYNYMEFSNDPTIAAVSTVVVAATFVVVWLLHKTVGLGGFFQ
jgi:putative spermidine/putrescine transport system permease protein